MSVIESQDLWAEDVRYI